MGKQRTPQGRQTGRGTPPRKSAAPAPAATVDAVLPEAPAEPLHAHLMDTVSPEALGTAVPASEPVVASPEAPVPADAHVAEPPAESPASHAAETADRPAADAVPDPVPTLRAAPSADAAPADRYANVVPLKSSAPVPAAEVPEPVVSEAAPAQPSDGALPAPASWRAGRRTGVPLRQDLEGMGETLFAFMRSESSAALAHLNALKDVRSPADAIRLQVNEIQRAADASLTCWSEIARRASRIVAQR